MKIILIAAMDRNGAIGAQGGLPWHCPADLKHFRNLTTGRVCLMGRRTAESLKKPLRDRLNLVLTRDRKWSKDGFIPVHTMRDIKKIMTRYNQDELWVIGGGDIYRKYINQADVVHLTILDCVVPNADTWFPVDGLTQYHGVVTQSCVDPKVNFWVFTRHPTPTTRTGGGCVNMECKT